MTYSNICTSIWPYKGINKNTIINIWSSCLNFVTCSLVHRIRCTPGYSNRFNFPDCLNFIPRNAFSPTTATPMLASWKLTFVFLCSPFLSLLPHRRQFVVRTLWLQCETCSTNRDTSYTILCLEYYPMCSKSKRNGNTVIKWHTSINNWDNRVLASLLYNNFAWGTQKYFWGRGEIFCVWYTNHSYII